MPDVQPKSRFLTPDEIYYGPRETWQSGQPPAQGKSEFIDPARLLVEPVPGVPQLRVSQQYAVEDSRGTVHVTIEPPREGDDALHATVSIQVVAGALPGVLVEPLSTRVKLIENRGGAEGVGGGGAFDQVALRLEGNAAQVRLSPSGASQVLEWRLAPVG